MSLTFSVCIPTVRAATLEAAIRSALAQGPLLGEVLVLGQGDEDALRAATAATAAGDGRVRYVHLQQRGLSRARNAAVVAARHPIVAFLDDDCEADPNWLTALAAGFARREDVGLVGGAVIAPPPRSRPSSCPSIAPSEAVYDPSASPGTPPAGWDWMGANFAIRGEVARLIGSWDPCLGAGADFPAGEDTDFKLRLEAAGVVMVTTPAARILHTGGTRYGRNILRSQRAYASGNGALAGKLTLLGDPRGRQWRRETRNGALMEWARQRRPHRLLKDLRRLWFFDQSYRRCLRDYRIGDGGVLRPSSQPPAPPPGTEPD